MENDRNIVQNVVSFKDSDFGSIVLIESRFIEVTPSGDAIRVLYAGLTLDTLILVKHNPKRILDYMNDRLDKNDSRFDSDINDYEIDRILPLENMNIEIQCPMLRKIRLELKNGEMIYLELSVRNFKDIWHEWVDQIKICNSRINLTSVHNVSNSSGDEVISDAMESIEDHRTKERTENIVDQEKANVALKRAGVNARTLSLNNLIQLDQSDDTTASMVSECDARVGVVNAAFSMDEHLDSNGDKVEANLNQDGHVPNLSPIRRASIAIQNTLSRIFSSSHAWYDIREKEQITDATSVDNISGNKIQNDVTDINSIIGLETNSDSSSIKSKDTHKPGTLSNHNEKHLTSVNSIKHKALSINEQPATCQNNATWIKQTIEKEGNNTWNGNATSIQRLQTNFSERSIVMAGRKMSLFAGDLLGLHHQAGIFTNSSAGHRSSLSAIYDNPLELSFYSTASPEFLHPLETRQNMRATSLPSILQHNVALLNEGRGLFRKTNDNTEMGFHTKGSFERKIKEARSSLGKTDLEFASYQNSKYSRPSLSIERTCSSSSIESIDEVVENFKKTEPKQKRRILGSMRKYGKADSKVDLMMDEPDYGIDMESQIDHMMSRKRRFHLDISCCRRRKSNPPDMVLLQRRRGGVTNIEFAKCKPAKKRTHKSLVFKRKQVAGESLVEHVRDVDPVILAQEMSLIDKEMFVHVEDVEFIDCAWTKKDKYTKSPNIMAMIDFFERVANLVCTEILSEETPQQRASVMAQWITVAQRLLKMSNFNSLQAVLGGLQLHPVFRLQDTWEILENKFSNKYKSYREALETAISRPPAMPFLGVLLQTVLTSQAMQAMRAKHNDADTERQEDSPLISGNKSRRSCSFEKKNNKITNRNIVENKVPPQLDLVSSCVVHTSNQNDDMGHVSLDSSLEMQCCDVLDYDVEEQNVESEDMVLDSVEFTQATPYHETNKAKRLIKKSNETLHNILQVNRTTHTVSKLSNPQFTPDDNEKKRSSENKECSCVAGNDTSSNRFRRHVLFKEEEKQNQGLMRYVDPKELLFQYQMSSIHYNFTTERNIRDFLLRASYNTNEENYHLSCSLEPPRKC
ncbi:unnamed protein product [Owenia fusiformis]|uniref:Ras-GEF domain-containing protein n=1 Tax=Owenia fusiformis TaxID=6347 RepID=A0A8S4MX26_OWEFU|nr:unnamed protein product [Owenia fusiformis]